MIDMSAFIAAKSDQLNADDLMDSPRTITVTKVTAQPDAAEQPVAIHYDGGEGRPFKPCKTMRRVMVAVWGKDASKYVGRSMTLFRDPNVQFGGMQVGGLRISHMSHIDKAVTVALLVTRGRKAPYTVQPLCDVPQPSDPQDFTAELAKLKQIAKPGNMDALGAKWKEIGQDARKALAAELPALKAACEPEDDGFDSDDADNPETNDTDEHPAKAKADEILLAIDEVASVVDLNSLMANHKDDIAAMPDELADMVNRAANAKKADIKEAAKAKEEAG